MKTIKVKVLFEDDVLGLCSGNPELHREYIASKSGSREKEDEEVEAIDVNEAFEKAMTVFPKMADGTPFFYDYQIRGFLKEAWGALKKVPGTQASKYKAYKKTIDNLVFVTPREIPLDMQGMKLDICERPLRASTPQGERIALASSEYAPAGTSCEFEIMTLVDEYEDVIKECLDYGVLKGMGQWRNSGKGRFKYEIIK